MLRLATVRGKNLTFKPMVFSDPERAIVDAIDSHHDGHRDFMRIHGVIVAWCNVSKAKTEEAFSIVRQAVRARYSNVETIQRLRDLCA